MAREFKTISTDEAFCNRTVHTFTLERRGMVERKPVHQFGYWAHRADIRRAFQKGVTIAKSGCGGEVLREPWMEHDVVKSENCISIGCMTFSGKNFKALRNWARRKA